MKACFPEVKNKDGTRYEMDLPRFRHVIQLPRKRELNAFVVNELPEPDISREVDTYEFVYFEDGENTKAIYLRSSKP